jgi:hypothetical protein
MLRRIFTDFLQLDEVQASQSPPPNEYHRPSSAILNAPNSVIN